MVVTTEQMLCQHCPSLFVGYFLVISPNIYLTLFLSVQRSELPCDLNGADRQRSEAVSKSSGDQCMGRCCPGTFSSNKCIKQMQQTNVTTDKCNKQMQQTNVTNKCNKQMQQINVTNKQMQQSSNKPML